MLHIKAKFALYRQDSLLFEWNAHAKLDVEHLAV